MMAFRSIPEVPGITTAGRRASRGRVGRVRRSLCLAALALAGAASSGASGGASASAPAAREGTAASHSSGGGIASYALPIGEDFSWIFPIENTANYEDWDSNVEGGMWRPLYFAGNGSRTGIDGQLSIANPPVYSNNDTTVTVTMKPGFTWSDGTKVTSADVRFFFELLAAGKTKDGAYIPGELPDDVKSISYPGPYTFVLHLTRSYSPLWFTGNQLTWIYPLPAQAWDKTCATCKVGNAAATPSGAKSVFSFLYSQSEDLRTYASNPLWKTVDGPWVVSSYDPTTYAASFRRNNHYTGPGKPRLAGYQIYSFASDTAELDALRSGTITFGFLPFSDVSQTSYFSSHGFTVKPWQVFYNEVVELGYTNKTYGPLVRQLYIRQALQHLVDEQLYLSRTLHGFGLADYGVAPDYPGSSYVSKQLRSDPYPYSTSAAAKLLSAHGWASGPGGIDVCKRPGTKSDECGAGITKGKQLAFSFMYSTGTPSFAAQVEAYQTVARSVGIGITLNGQTESTMFSIGGVCPTSPPCNWGLLAYSSFMWDFGQYELLPVGGNEFGKGNFWAGGYSSAEAQHLINAAHETPGLQALYADENFLSTNVASLWWPLSDYEIVVAKDNLHGWKQLNPYANFHPSAWYFTS
ncbi:MAG: ABC transporter substrate-binding protein [Acidimicrobiales bacterium]